MAGIYLHIPFCKQKCHYCDFHFSTNLNGFDEMVDAICEEAHLRSSYLENEEVTTIYFGGGTPSLLSESQLQKIFHRLQSNFKLGAETEITLECNPDDLSSEILKMLNANGINRLSIGIQSFDDEVLKFMNRAHDSKQANECLEQAKREGFENITLDLIYGLPDRSNSYWRDQLNQFLGYEIPHLSAYCLTIEDNTFFGNQAKKGMLSMPEQDAALGEFDTMRNFLKETGYEHYEVSNFARPTYISKHNSSYWLGKKYLGLGPSAHSYSQTKRSWNVANNAEYMRELAKGNLPLQEEEIGSVEKFNEYILTRLRTKWGIKKTDLVEINQDAYLKIESQIEKLISAGTLREEEGIFYLSDKDVFVVDHITAQLFS